MDLRERIRIVKSLLDVTENELLKFLVIPRAWHEIDWTFGADGILLLQILLFEGKVVRKIVNGELKYVVNYALLDGYVDRDRIMMDLFKIINALRERSNK